MELEWILRIFVFVFGTIVGSFLNVCVVRLPLTQSVVFPGSHCAACKKPISWYDNVPILSYLLLRGRCRHCQQKFSPRYMLIEVLTGVLFLIFYVHFGLNLVLIPYFVLISGLIVATFVDLEYRIIPDEISIGGLFAGLMISFFVTDLHDLTHDTLNMGRLIMGILVGICAVVHLLEYLFKREAIESYDFGFFVFIGAMLCYDLLVNFFIPVNAHYSSTGLERHLLSLDAAVIGFLIGAGAIYAMGLLGDFLFKKETMGGGDIKLMAMVGAFLGWKAALLGFFIAPFFGAIFGIAEKIRTKESTIAYGPFLALGALIALFWGDQLIRWIASGYGLYN